MKLFPARQRCRCRADRTMESAVEEAFRSGEWKRAKRIFHWRASDQATFWHWSDQEVVLI